MSIGLVIDDLVVLQRCLTEQLEDLRARPGSSFGAQRLRSALSAYDAAKLRYSAKKLLRLPSGVLIAVVLVV